MKCVNKVVVNVKILPNEYSVMFLALKTTQFWSRNGQETGAVWVSEAKQHVE